MQASGTPQPIHFLKAHDVSHPNSDGDTKKDNYKDKDNYKKGTNVTNMTKMRNMQNMENILLEKRKTYFPPSLPTSRQF